MNRIRVFALALLALCGLTAFMAAGAQANWLENGAELTANKNVFAKSHTTFGALIVSSLNIEFRCTTLKQEGLKLVAKSTTAEGKVAFSGCTAWSKEAEQKQCNPSVQPIVAGGLALIKLLALTKNGTLLNVILFEQKGTEPFATVVVPGGCALAETSNVTGSLVAECGLLSGTPAAFVQEDCKEAGVKHLLQAPAQTVWWESNGAGGHKEVIDKLKFGENAATLGGIAEVELESHESWAGHV